MSFPARPTSSARRWIGRRRGTCSALVFVLTVLCIGLQMVLPDVATAQSSEGLTLRGRVLVASGGSTPVAFVTVGATWVQTDAQGTYSIQTRPTAEVIITAWAPGFTSETIKVRAAIGEILTGTVTVNFDGGFALHSALTDPEFGATLSGLPITTGAMVSTVSIQGTTFAPLDHRVMVTVPNGRVRSYILHTTGRTFRATVPFHALGSYQVEVSTATGIPVFNVTTFHGVPPGPPRLVSFAPDPASATTRRLANFALSLINQARRSAGLRLLVMRAAITRIALAHTADMIRFGYLGSHPHIGSDGSTPLERVQRLRLHRVRVGEDIGESYSVGAIIDAFLESPSHRAVLLGSYRWAGIGIAMENGSVLMTVDLVL